MPQITVHYEPADGQPLRPTGLHYERRDGTSVWKTGKVLDAIVPSGSPRTMRQILRRLRLDTADLPKIRRKGEAASPNSGRRRIRIHLADQDAEQSRPRRIHVDHGNGRASYVRDAELDTFTPDGSPHTLRVILRRLRNDSDPLDAFTEAPGTEAPNEDAIDHDPDDVETV